MKRITLATLVCLLLAVVPVRAQSQDNHDPVPPPAPTDTQEPVVKAKRGFVLHPELFATFGTSYFEDVLLDDGAPPGGFTVSMTYQLGFGPGRWSTCDPDTDRECTEANAPRFAVSGIGVAWAPNGGVGWGVQFPLLTVRIVRNAWISSAVTVWPKAPDWRRNATFTVGLGIALTPGR